MRVKISNLTFHENSIRKIRISLCGETDGHDEASSCYLLCSKSQNGIWKLGFFVHCNSWGILNRTKNFEKRIAFLLQVQRWRDILKFSEWDQSNMAFNLRTEGIQFSKQCGLFRIPYGRRSPKLSYVEFNTPIHHCQNYLGNVRR